MSRSYIQFPRDFLFGVAAASYQIEGAYREDGRGESIWDRFSHTPGKVYQGHTGDIACDHYHRFQEDIALMRDLAIPAYRLSIAWPRIFPEKGKFNQKGVDFYRRVLEALHEANIDPAVTLYHWDLPQWIEDQGGWVNRDTINYFAEYASRVYMELADLVPHFITHNEPWCVSFLGYGLGEHAPGHTDWREALTAAHHLLLSHGLAVQAYRAGGYHGDIGITLNFTWVDPVTDAQADREAATRLSGFSNRWFLDPIFRKSYPEDMLEWVNTRVGGVDFLRSGDFDTIAQPIDFLGVNYYTRAIVGADDADPLLGVYHVNVPAEVKTEMGWEVHPNSLYRLLKWISSDYTGNLPLYITENGAAFHDDTVSGAVHDARRLDYIADHLLAARQFVDEGGPLHGYYLWSFMDNFEWAHGYSKRFGMVHVDYETQKRTVKDSGKWYSGQIAFNRE
ncbi:GH1 family beta-glucosidase [Alicyclobacillus dauci]|uniref:Beta-glucosidase n=1 Tax=Alicyclobacillus dauci TaxID=1475485 RepID=A0ABY6Z411_9BACL|nr:GH1 family beta-glucosidase [Alicyclobacillus dauci]WAH37624.1 GH1 family beta-glucosidase [Alicyclobacillus dauci]